MPVRILFNDELVFEFPEEEIGNLEVLRAVCLYSKFNIDKRDITLDNELIVGLIDGIDRFLAEKHDEKSENMRKIYQERLNLLDMPEYLLKEVIDYCEGNDPYNDRFNSEENVRAFLKKAIFPFKISSEKFSATIQKILQNQKSFKYTDD